MTTEEADRIAEAPSTAGPATKLTTPPSTGSTGLLAVTVTASGLANDVPMAVGLRRAAGDGREGEALALEGADVHGADDAARRAGRWGWRRPRSRRRWRGCRAAGHRLRRPAVVAQGAQPGVGHADQVAVDPVDQTARAAGADQVVGARDRADDVAGAAEGVRIAGDDRVGQRDRAADCRCRRRRGNGGVAADRGAGHRQQCRY